MPGSSRRLPQVPVLGVTVLLLGGLAACGVEPAPSASPSVSEEAGEPIFASDEEALAAAVEAYEAYNDTYLEVASDPASDVNVIRSFVSVELAAQSIAEFEGLRENGARIVGEIGLRDAKLLERSENDGLALVSVYVCRDVSAGRLVNSDGVDVTPVDRDDVQPQQASFTSADRGSASLIVEGLQRWQGDDFC